MSDDIKRDAETFRQAWQSAQADLAASNAILEAVEAALDGEPVSDFMESFPLVARVQELRFAADAAQREADRLRHGAPVEGDFVCPDSLALAAALNGNACDDCGAWNDSAGCAHGYPRSVGCSAFVERSLAAGKEGP